MYYHEIEKSEVLPQAPDCPGGTIYTIQAGDTLFRIANRYQINLIDLIIANPQINNPNVIFVNQKICIPQTGIVELPPGEFCEDGTIYIAIWGDSMYNIARRWGITVEKLIQYNPQIGDPNLLEPGQEVCIPT